MWAQENRPSGLREAADSRINLVVWEQEERVWREAGKGSGLLSHAAGSCRTEEPLLAESLMPVPSPSPRIV